MLLPIETILLNDSLNENMFWQMRGKKMLLLFMYVCYEFTYVLLFSYKREVSRGDDRVKAYTLKHHSLEITYIFSCLFIL